MRPMNKLVLLYKRHKKLFLVCGVIIAIYVVIRLLFTPPLLSNVSFGNAYYDRNGNLMVCSEREHTDIASDKKEEENGTVF